MDPPPLLRNQKKRPPRRYKWFAISRVNLRRCAEFDCVLSPRFGYALAPWLFQVVEHCERHRPWHIAEVNAVRWNFDPEDQRNVVEILVQYRGFALPEWVPLDATHKRLLTWKSFYAANKAEVDALADAPKHGSGVAASAEFAKYLPCQNGEGLLRGNGFDAPELVKAAAQFRRWQARYREEKARGWIVPTRRPGRASGDHR